ncbi:MAG TPA: hypothetical protein ENJ53_03115 [Phaeodactylibacter sp.]|nr:hypothetical protein [Phaeodactylibacter sp.]
MSDNSISNKLFLTLITILLHTTFLSASTIRFISVDYPTAIQLSTEQHKFFFVNYSAKWCPTCTVMEETANANLELLDYIHNNFIAIKADVDDAIGKEWQDRYEVSCLPTLIVFSPNGKEITRIGGGLTASEFLLILKSIEGENSPYAITSSSQNDNASMAVSSSDNISNQNEFSSKGGFSDSEMKGNNEKNASSSFDAKGLPNNANTENTEFEIVIEMENSPNKPTPISPKSSAFQVSHSESISISSSNSSLNGTNKVSSENNLASNSSQSDANHQGHASASYPNHSTNSSFSGGHSSSRNSSSNESSSISSNQTTVVVRSNCASFGVQVGMYANKDNADRKINRMQQKLSQPVFVQQQIVNGKLLYQVIVGEYLDLQDAIHFQKKLTSKGIKGYLVQR